MPRLMAVALTLEQVRDRSKTVTRRKSWMQKGRFMLAPGDPLVLCEKVQGRKPGERLVRIVTVTVISVRRERLDAVTPADVIAEGFPEYSPEQFIKFFCDSHPGCAPSTEITRIEWRYGSPPGEAPGTFGQETPVRTEPVRSEAVTLLRLAAGEGRQDAECAWDGFVGLRPPAPCGEQAVCTVTDFCVCAHGHGRVFEARACARHAEMTLGDGPCVCGQCAEAGCGGRAVTVITLGGSIALAAEGEPAKAAPGVPVSEVADRAGSRRSEP